MEDRLAELPKGWMGTTLTEACQRVTDGSHYTPKYSPKGYPFITITDVRNDKIDFSKAKLISKNDYDKLKDNCNPHFGDILFSKDGTVGKVIEIDFEREFVVLSSLAIIRFNPKCILPKFMKNLLQSKLILDQATGLKTGTALTRIILRNLNKVHFPLPPLPEQHRIVAKIEELFTRLDAGVEALKKIRAQLKRYHRAVLKYAFEGKLTEEWREANKGKIEPASVLLEKVKEQRKKEAKGKIKGLPPIDTSGFAKLPEGWVWARIDLVCSKIQDGSHFSPKIQFDAPGDGRYLYITAKNIKENGIDLSEVTYIDSSFHKAIYSRCNPQKEDVLLIKDGVKTGIATVNTLEDEISLLSSVALFKPNRVGLQPYYLKHFLNSPVGFKMTTERMTGTAIKRIILEKVRSAYIPLPSFPEQQKIVEEIERRLSIADNMEKVAEQSLKQSVRLRQSVLKRAFDGKLVPQDPTDEPAERLLNRIKEEKAKREGENKREKKHRSKKTKQMELI